MECDSKPKGACIIISTNNPVSTSTNPYNIYTYIKFHVPREGDMYIKFFCLGYNSNPN